MNDQAPYRRAGFTVFPDAPNDEPGVCAVLFTKNVDTGEIHAYVKEYEGFHAPDPEIVMALRQSVELRNL